jgi:hypothetical protein
VFGSFVNDVLIRLGLISVAIPFNWTGDMEEQDMILTRRDYTDRSTIGDLYLDSVFQCYTLELSTRKQEGVKNCIPSGKYEILMQYSARFEMDTPHLQNVPGRTFIEIHPGNKPEDTEGCILLGQTKEADWVGSSRVAYQELVPKIESKLAQGKLYLEIIGG